MAPPLTEDEIVAADILSSRQAAARDAVRESRALDALLTNINGDPTTALHALVETTVSLTGGGSAGVSILEKDRFVWSAIAGEWARYAGGGMPRDASPCGLVIQQNRALLFDRPHRLFPEALGEPQELLLVPLSAGSAPFGTLWVVFHNDYRFTASTRGSSNA